MKEIKQFVLKLNTYRYLHRFKLPNLFRSYSIFFFLNEYFKLVSCKPVINFIEYNVLVVLHGQQYLQKRKKKWCYLLCNFNLFSSSTRLEIQRTRIRADAISHSILTFPKDRALKSRALRLYRFSGNSLPWILSEKMTVLIYEDRLSHT